jgi:tRNA(fMet)-specific endonuclease VapC
MYLLDTNIISYLFLGNDAVHSKFTNIPPDKITTCSIVCSELLYGANKNSLNSDKKNLLNGFYNQLFGQVQIFEYDLSSARIFANLKINLEESGKIIEDFDLMIASVTIDNNLILVTNNTKYFDKIKGLKLENWTTDPETSSG